MVKLNKGERRKSRSFLVDKYAPGHDFCLDHLGLSLVGSVSNNDGVPVARVILQSIGSSISLHSGYGDIVSYLRKIDIVGDELRSFITSLELRKPHFGCKMLNPLNIGSVDAGGSSTIVCRSVPDFVTVGELMAVHAEKVNAGIWIDTSSVFTITSCGAKLTVRRSSSVVERPGDSCENDHKLATINSCTMESYIAVLKYILEGFIEHKEFVTKWLM